MPRRQKEVSTQEAAEILNISEPYVIKILNEGQLAFKKVGSHKYIKLTDLLEYKNKSDQESRKALDELTKISQELNLYPFHSDGIYPELCRRILAQGDRIKTK